MRFELARQAAYRLIIWYYILNLLAQISVNCKYFLLEHHLVIDLFRILVHTNKYYCEIIYVQNRIAHSGNQVGLEIACETIYGPEPNIGSW